MGFKHPLKRIKCYFCYGRCFSFFIAYAGSGEMPLDVLGDYLRVWRTVRGIGVSAALLAGIGFAIHAPNFSGWQGLILPILVFAIVLFLSMVIVGINFNRLSASLLASVWVVARKDEELKAASIDEVKKSLKHRPPKQLHGSHGPAKPATLAQMLD
jgi:hypothetical protein